MAGGGLFVRTGLAGVAFVFTGAGFLGGDAGADFFGGGDSEPEVIGAGTAIVFVAFLDM